MPASRQFDYTQVVPGIGNAGQLPMVELTLTRQSQSIIAKGLLDSGAMVNVLPFGLGLQLGADWDALNVPIQLRGNLANYPAKGILLSAQVANFPSVRLAFAWTQATNVPMILGQTNFFEEFDVCFFRSRLKFEITPHSG